MTENDSAVLAKTVLESGLKLDEVIATLQSIYDIEGNDQLVIFETEDTSWTIQSIAMGS
jgi:hypothetical protein